MKTRNIDPIPATDKDGVPLKGQLSLCVCGGLGVGGGKFYACM